MDVQPEGWTYPSGKPLEPEWWWQWTPSERSAQEAISLLGTPIASWNSPLPLKSGVSFQMSRKYGEVQAIEAIPVQRLPHLMKRDATWTFEFDFDQSFRNPGE